VIEYRYADNQRDRLPGLASDLVRQQAAVIVANSLATRAAKTVTTAVPIVFVSGEDPVRSGLVDSVRRAADARSGDERNDFETDAWRRHQLFSVCVWSPSIRTQKPSEP
jgi:putative ABC transport system substrate-binding protein